ncbi:uncharacterized protein PRCAT00005524001 [Priceomyces carsonii]|uniref:uncharacterized protein n=1 Tax=Priceomyces carsonii TaxID=28549 RepID=UPI002ED8BBF0|nr:unnamed protein product [Priceomyces carsonii]
MTKNKRLKYTYGIVYCPELRKVLLLNRQKSPWMGRWNAVGGKLDIDESPRECIVRETYEETGLSLSQYVARGVTRWNVDDIDFNGMYLFTAQVSSETVRSYKTPVVFCHEGILDWKDIDWILDPQNTGIVASLQKLLKLILSGDKDDLYLLTYTSNDLTAFEYIPKGNVEYPVD